MAEYIKDSLGRIIQDTGELKTIREMLQGIVMGNAKDVKRKEDNSKKVERIKDILEKLGDDFEGHAKSTEKYFELILDAFKKQNSGSASSNNDPMHKAAKIMDAAQDTFEKMDKSINRLSHAIEAKPIGGVGGGGGGGAAPVNVDKIGADIAEAIERSVKKVNKKEMVHNIASWFDASMSHFLQGNSPLQHLFKGAASEQIEFKNNMTDIAWEVDGITAGMRGMQKEWINIGDQAEIVAQTGSRIDEVFNAMPTLMRKGIKDQKTALQISKSALSVANALKMDTTQTAEMFGEWNHHLKLSQGELSNAGRAMVAVARETGVSGQALAESVKASEELMKNMKKFGTLTSTSMKNVLTIMTKAKKLGVEEGAQKTIKAISSLHDYMYDTDEQTKRLVTMAAAQTGKVNELLSGTLLNSKAGAKSMATGMTDTVNGFLSRFGSSLEDIDSMAPQQRAIADMLAKQLFGGTLDELQDRISGFKLAGKGFSESMAEFQKELQSGTITAERRAQVEGNINSLIGNTGMSILTDFDKQVSKGVKDFDKLKMTSEQIQEAQALTGNKSGSKRDLTVSVMKKMADQIKAQGGKDLTGQLNSAISAGGVNNLAAIMPMLNDEMEKLRTAEERATDPMKDLAYQLAQTNAWLAQKGGDMVDALAHLPGAMAALEYAIYAAAAVQIGSKLYSGYKMLKGARGGLGGLGGGAARGAGGAAAAAGRAAGGGFAGMSGTMGQAATKTAAAGGGRALGAGGKLLGGASKGLKALGPIGTILGAGLDFSDRKAQGQTTTQAAIGTGGGVAGGLAGAAAGAAIGSVVPVVGTAIGAFVGGLAGWWGGGKLADAATGAGEAAAGAGGESEVAKAEDSALALDSAKTLLQNLSAKAGEIGGIDTRGFDDAIKSLEKASAFLTPMNKVLNEFMTGITPLIQREDTGILQGLAGSGFFGIFGMGAAAAMAPATAGEKAIGEGLPQLGYLLKSLGEGIKELEGIVSQIPSVDTEMINNKLSIISGVIGPITSQMNTMKDDLLPLTQSDWGFFDSIAEDLVDTALPELLGFMEAMPDFFEDLNNGMSGIDVGNAESMAAKITAIGTIFGEIKKVLEFFQGQVTAVTMDGGWFTDSTLEDYTENLGMFSSFVGGLGQAILIDMVGKLSNIEISEGKHKIAMDNIRTIAESLDATGKIITSFGAIGQEFLTDETEWYKFWAESSTKAQKLQAKVPDFITLVTAIGGAVADMANGLNANLAARGLGASSEEQAKRFSASASMFTSMSEALGGISGSINTAESMIDAFASKDPEKFKAGNLTAIIVNLSDMIMNGVVNPINKTFIPADLQTALDTVKKVNGILTELSAVMTNMTDVTTKIVGGRFTVAHMIGEINKVITQVSQLTNGGTIPLPPESGGSGNLLANVGATPSEIAAARAQGLNDEAILEKFGSSYSGTLTTAASANVMNIPNASPVSARPQSMDSAYNRVRQEISSTQGLADKSVELKRIDDVALKQLDQLVAIKEGVHELVELMKPKSTSTNRSGGTINKKAIKPGHSPEYGAWPDFAGLQSGATRQVISDGVS